MRVVAAVIRDEGKYLACRRGPAKELAGKWEFPGGKVEINESDEAALIREIHEELGVKVKVEEFIIQSSRQRGLGSIEMFTYFVRLEEDKPHSSSDHDRLEWLSPSELADYDWADLDMPVINVLISS